MSVIDEPTAAAEARIRRDSPPARHLGRAAGIELLGPVEGSGYKAGAALVRRADGQMVQLGTLLYALLECIDGERSLDELVAALSDRLGRRVEERHVVALAEKLAAQGLLAGSETEAPPKANPLLALRWKALVSNPEATRRLTRPFTFLFRPWILVPSLAGFAVTLWFVVIEKGVASATAQAFQRPGLLLLITALVVLSAGFHELGHAAACRYGGATPGGMGVGLYVVWPAFYTDVTDAYRLPRGGRLRVDLGGLYFNSLVAVATMGAWLLTGIDALLLLVALQVVEMVKQLSPVIRADGYHILADLTGVPDLFGHIGPTLRQLLPGRNEPSGLRGRARVIVTLWVLIVVPVLAALAITAILVLPRLAASAWASGRELVDAIPREAGGGDVLGVLTSVLELIALTLPVLGSIAVAQQLVRGAVRRGRAWSAGSPPRTAVAALAGVAALAALAWAWWPDGQYRPVRSDEDWTLPGLVQAAGVAPAVAADEPPQLAPGKHLAVAMIPRGGATKDRPALFVVRDRGRTPIAVVSTEAPPAQRSSAAANGATGPASGAATATPTAPPAQDEPPAAATTPSAPPAQASDTSRATVFPFKLPDEPRRGDTQAVATGKTDGGVTYDIAYAVVTVKDGADVTQRNGAYALASCKACTTVAVSFQVVLVVGQSDVIAPVNVAEALNVGCPSCVTAAFATQLVVSLRDEPTPALLRRLQQALERLHGIPSLDSTDAISKELADIQREIDDALDDSALRANRPTTTSATETPPSQTPPATTTPATTTPATTTPTAPADEEPQPATSTTPSQTPPGPPPEPTTTTPGTTAPGPTTTTPAGTSTTPAQTTTTSSTPATTP
jgi:putative peptide zinc metalloprotease protein